MGPLRQKAEQKTERMNLRKTGQDWHNYYYILAAWKIIMNRFHQQNWKLLLAL